jgi:Uma2 family endonuclease
MEWHEVVGHPSLKDLPFKTETNEWGKIVMTPASRTHAIYQAIIIKWFNRLSEQGIASPECPIKTCRGARVIVADVAWGSTEFFKKHGVRGLLFPRSPEIVVEVRSPSKGFDEMEEKIELCFEAGAREFWLCDQNGDMRFFNPQGELQRSEFFARFPVRIEIDVF